MDSGVRRYEAKLLDVGPYAVHSDSEYDLVAKHKDCVNFFFGIFGIQAASHEGERLNT